MSEERARALARLAVGLARGSDIPLPDSLLLWQLAGGRPAAAAIRSEDPAGQLDRALEASLGERERRRGAHHTPRQLADQVAAMALGETTRCRPTVVDPACGGGALLLAAGRRLVDAGLPIDVVARDLLWAADISPLAAAVTEAAITLWSGGTRPAGGHVAVADMLAGGREVWSSAPPRGFDALVGNPPFQAQLGRGTTRSPEETSALRERFGDAVAPYVDTAALFLLAGTTLLRAGGSLAMILPQSVAASRDAAPIRAALSERAELRELSIPEEQLFEASVHVCVAHLILHTPSPEATNSKRGVAERGFASPSAVAASAGRSQLPGASDDGLRSEAGAAEPRAANGARSHARPDWPGLQAAGWSARLATARGVPELELSASGGTIGDMATAVAGFRDEYYGLVGHIREAGTAAEAPLVTSGSIDIGTCSWGERPVRFAKQRWDRPEVDLTGLASSNPKLAAWLERVRRPKVLVASQTRAIEAWVDERGTAVPVTPLISVLPSDPADALRVAAALCSPPVSVWAARLAAGTALSPSAIRVSARLVLAAPLPSDEVAWGAATHALAQRDLSRFGELATYMYRLPTETAAAVIAWWTSNLPVPTPRRART